ncbi:hypothetical protein [Undibacterium squillarum]|uniref:hypothetical protein n=1 Tax=Undibacterium squillarum TaxID=1131567 RepID=UPI0035AF5BC5
MVAADYARWVFDLLGLLRQVDESFSRLYLVERYEGGYKSTDVDEGEFERLIFANLQKDLAYTNPISSERGLTRDSRCALGFSTSFITSEKPNASSALVEIRIGRSAPNSVNTLIIRCPNSHPGDYFAKLLRALVKYSDPLHAHCWSQAFGERINQPVGDIYIGWLTYLSDGRVAEPLKDIAATETFWSGVLIETTNLHDFSMNEQVIANALAIVGRLGGMGFLTNPSRRKA